jgi:hypothetical protein
MREGLKAVAPEAQDDCIFWIDENGVPIGPENAPEHDVECVFSGGTVWPSRDPDAPCFTCFVIQAAKAVSDAGRRTTVHNIPEQYDLLVIPDTEIDIAHEAFSGKPPLARIARGDGRIVEIYRIQRAEGESCEHCDIAA